MEMDSEKEYQENTRTNHDIQKGDKNTPREKERETEQSIEIILISILKWSKTTDKNGQNQNAENEKEC